MVLNKNTFEDSIFLSTGGKAEVYNTINDNTAEQINEEYPSAANFNLYVKLPNKCVSTSNAKETASIINSVYSVLYREQCTHYSNLEH